MPEEVSYFAQVKAFQAEWFFSEIWQLLLRVEIYINESIVEYSTGFVK
jgi:hypothetical protein